MTYCCEAFSVECYTVSGKKNLQYSMHTSSDTARYAKSFNFHSQQEICIKVIINYPTSS